MFDKRKWKALQEAVQADDPKRVDLRYFSMDRCYEACKLAIQHDASKVLQALAETKAKGVVGRFVFAAAWDQSKTNARALIKATASSSDPAPLLQALYNANKVAHSSSKLGDEDFLTKDTSDELVKDILQENPMLFKHCVNNVGMALPKKEKLEVILDFASLAPNAQLTLDQALVQAAKTGDIEKAKLLLAHDANPNHDKGAALLSASEGGHKDHKDIAGLLLPRMKPALCSDAIYALERSEHRVPEAIISSIRARIVEALPQSPEIDGLTRVDDHTLSGTQTLPGGLTLTTVFNFALQQQLFIKTVGGESVVDKVISFDDLKPEVVTDLQEKLDILNGKKAPQATTPRALRLKYQ